MRKNRVIEQNRCYHLVSRLAHRAFFLDDEEKDRAVALMRRVEEFSGVVVLAYAFMSNHFHIFIYMPSAERRGLSSGLARAVPDWATDKSVRTQECVRTGHGGCRRIM